MFSPVGFFTSQRQAEGVTGPLIFTAMMFALPFLGILFTFMWLRVPLGIALAIAAAGAGFIVPVNSFHNSLWLSIITRVTTRKGTYTGAVRILTFSMAPYVLMVIPFVGFLAGIYAFILLVIGLMKTFELSGGQTALVLILYVVVMSIIFAIPFIVTIPPMWKMISQALNPGVICM